MTRRPPRALLLSSALSLPLLIGACSDDTTALDDEAGDSETGAEDTGETGEPEEEARYAYAPGIRLTRLTLNQAVQVELVNGDTVTAPEDYTVNLLAGRNMLVRAHYVVHHDFEARELLAILTIEYPPDEDGEVEVFKDESLVLVDGDSNERSLAKIFAWYLQAEQVREGMQVRVDVYEPEPLAEGEEPVYDPDAVGPDALDAPALPWTVDAAPVQLSSQDMRIEVVFVPIRHELDGCVSEWEVAEEEAQVMADELLQNNPVQAIDFSIREPLVYTEPIGEQGSGFSPVLTELSKLHDEDGAAPWVYYYGLISSCDGYPSGLAGQAIAIPQTADMGQGYQRVSAGRWYGSGMAASETFVHEVGHSQGRFHVRCSGEAGVDPDYPHAGGITNVWGFGLFDLRLRSPAGSRDYMTYCANEWVSDYGWQHVWERIATLTAWQNQGAETTGQEILVGALYPDGSEDWWTTRGTVVGEPSAQYGLEWQLDGEILSMPAWISEQADGDTLNVAALLPAGELEGASFRLDAPLLAAHGQDPEARVAIDTITRTPQR